MQKGRESISIATVGSNIFQNTLILIGCFISFTYFIAHFAISSQPNGPGKHPIQSELGNNLSPNSVVISSYLAEYLPEDGRMWCFSFF